MASSFNEQRLAYFFQALRSGTIRAAADELDLAPSAVSRQIALLEEELGVALIERHRRGIMPTEAGQLVADYYRQQQSHQADLLSKVGELRGLRRGHVAVVLGEGFVGDLMAAAVAHFSARHPQISLTLDLAGTNEVIRRVAEDEVEIGLVYNPPPDARIVTRTRHQQPMHAIVHPRHALAQQAHCTLAEVARADLGLMHGAYGTRQLLALAAYSARVHVEPKVSTNSISVLKHYVMLGHGVTVLPRFAVDTEIAQGLLVAVPIAEPLFAHAEAHLITRAGRRLSLAASRFVSYSASLMKAFQVSGD